jgi:uncharacterized protein YcbX
VAIKKGETRKLSESPAKLLLQDVRDSDETYLADLAPISLTVDGSLAALNECASEPVPMDRFRANVVVSISKEFAFCEDWLSIPQLTLRA